MPHVIIQDSKKVKKKEKIRVYQISKLNDYNTSCYGGPKFGTPGAVEQKSYQTLQQ